MSDSAEGIYRHKKIRIIGQGLAGSVLALMLDDAGYDVVIHDDGHLSSSSIVAAGMWNPLSFKKLHASWLAEKLIPAAFEAYRKFESKLGVNFFHPLDLIRIFPDVRSANEWDERSVHPEIEPFAGNEPDESFIQHVDMPYGAGTVKRSGWLDTKLFLDAVRNYFQLKGKIEINVVTAENVHQFLTNNEVVIQCTGWKLIDGSYFSWLPVLRNKGEVLTVSMPRMTDSNMFNFGKFIIPVGNGVFRLGATYELNPIHLDPTPEAGNELAGDLKEHVKHTFEVLQHDTGYRPTVPDRKPLIGFDDEQPLAGVFNGFGSKGVLLIPYFAAMLLDHMQSGAIIPKEVNFSRYITRFRK